MFKWNCIFSPVCMSSDSCPVKCSTDEFCSFFTSQHQVFIRIKIPLEPSLPQTEESQLSRPFFSWDAPVTSSFSMNFHWTLSSMSMSFLYWGSPGQDMVVQHKCWTEGNKHYFPQPDDYTFANTVQDMAGHFPEGAHCSFLFNMCSPALLSYQLGCCTSYIHTS